MNSPLSELSPGRRLPPAGVQTQDPRAQLERIESAFEKRKNNNRMLAVLAIAMIWSAAAAYYCLVPPQYVSRWSLIVPVSNNGSQVNLDTIGQASSTPSQTFGTLHMSPKVIYREIITSDQVRKAAANSLSVTAAQFGRPRVRLIDETGLLLLQISGSTPEQAQAKAKALSDAFNAQIDQLRRDEYDKRSAVMRESLKFYQATLDKARERIQDFQSATGLLSQAQFTETSTSAELMRRKLADKRSDLEKVANEFAMLTSRVGFDPQAAIAGLRLAADPAFTRIAAGYAEASSLVHENNLRYGPAHPAQVAAQMKLAGSYTEIVKIARQAQVDPSIDLRRLMLFLNVSGQVELLRTIVSTEASMMGMRKEVASQEAELKRVEGEVTRMGADAARLEALRKDHLIAEAVFSSAAARLDTNRTDLFQSYPLVQVLAAPDLAEERTQPRLSYAIGAGMLGTLMVLAALAATWLARRFRRTRSRKR